MGIGQSQCSWTVNGILETKVNQSEGHLEKDQTRTVSRIGIGIQVQDL